MIDLIQWRSVIGCFVSKWHCKYTNIPTCYDGVLHTLLNSHFVLHTAVLIIYVYVNSMLLLCCGDIEMNPGPIPYVLCPNCKSQVHIRKISCDCGYRLLKKRGRLPGSSSGRPVGTTTKAGFTASTGHPTADVDIEMNVPMGRPVGTTAEAGFNVSTGHPTADVDIEINVPIGHPVHDVDVEMNVPMGRPVGTTAEAGFNVSTGHPTADVDIEINVPIGHPVHDVDVEMNVPKGRPVGTTAEAGFNVSTGHPTADVDIEINDVDIEINVPISRPVHDVDVEMNVPMGRPVGTTVEAGFNTSLGCPNSSSISIGSSIENNCSIDTEDADLIIYRRQFESSNRAHKTV